jgi:hypothetical protein
LLIAVFSWRTQAKLDVIISTCVSSGYVQPVCLTHFFEEKQEGQAPTVNAFQSKDRVQSTKYKEKQGTRMKEQKEAGKPRKTVTKHS